MSLRSFEGVHTKKRKKNENEWRCILFSNHPNASSWFNSWIQNGLVDDLR